MLPTLCVRAFLGCFEHDLSIICFVYIYGNCVCLKHVFPGKWEALIVKSVCVAVLPNLMDLAAFAPNAHSPNFWEQCCLGLRGMETPVIYLHFLNIISQAPIKRRVLFVHGPDACVQYGEEGLVVGERDRRGAAERKDPGNLLDHHWCVSPENPLLE